MNTPRPPDLVDPFPHVKRPSWTIISDHQSVHGNPGEWAAHASVQVVDGLGAYVLREEATALLIEVNQDPARLLMLCAPEPAWFFSFSRFQSSLTSMDTAEDGWLYSVFGYLLPNTRVYLTVLPSHSEYHCEPRSTPFVLLS